MYVPKLLHNLLSVSEKASKRKSFEFGQSHCNIIDNKFGVIATATKCGNLCYLNCAGSNLSVKKNHTAMKCASTDQTKESIWHGRYGHLGARNLEQIAKEQLVDGFDYEPKKESRFMNHVLMVSRVHCHLLRQEEIGLMNYFVSFTVMYLERLRQSYLVEQNTS